MVITNILAPFVFVRYRLDLVIVVNIYVMKRSFGTECIKYWRDRPGSGHVNKSLGLAKCALKSIRKLRVVSCRGYVI